MKKALAWSLLIAGIVGFCVTFPAWLLGWINDRSMLGITLALSWAALWYEGVVAIWTHEED